MSKKRNIGDEVIEALEDSIQHIRGKKTRARIHKVEIPDSINVKAFG